MADVIPVLDLGPYLAGKPGARETLGAQLRQAFIDVGFYFIVNHGVPQALVDRTFDEAKRFHAMPLDEKLALKINEHNIGYMPMRGATNRFNNLGQVYKPNANEAVFFKRDLPADHPDVIAKKRFRGVNQWPQNLPGFRERILEYCDALERLCRGILPIYATALDVAPTYFDRMFTDPMYTLRMSHYPPAEPMSEGQEWGLAPHTDTSFMTLLAQNRIPGLSLRLPSGEWVDAPAPEGAFLVNGGNMLRLWTNHLFLATPHRVVNRSGTERYAIPFFFDAGWGETINPVPTTVDAAHPRQSPATTYAEYMETYQRANFHHTQETPAELQPA